MPKALPPQIAALVNAAAIRFGVPREFARAVAWVESNGNQNAVSPAGAIGVMQLMPDTARGLGVDPHNVHANIEGGVRLLAKYLRDFSKTRTAAAYNAGPVALYTDPEKWPAETRAYVAKVLMRASQEEDMDPQPNASSTLGASPARAARTQTLGVFVVAAGAVALTLGCLWSLKT